MLAAGRNVNILVLDTEVYSNTGGQASKATPRGAVAKFAAAGKSTRQEGPRRHRPGLRQRLRRPGRRSAPTSCRPSKALLEADAWPGPSLVIAYSTCIAHGIDMATSMSHQKDAVKSGYWPLYRFHPSEIDEGQPFKLDSHKPSIPRADFVATEARYAMLARTRPRPGPGPGRARCRPTSTSAGGTTSSSPAMHRTVPHVDRHRRATTPGGGRHDRPHHQLPRPRPALADRGVGVSR